MHSFSFFCRLAPSFFFSFFFRFVCESARASSYNGIYFFHALMNHLVFFFLASITHRLQAYLFLFHIFFFISQKKQSDRGKCDSNHGAQGEPLPLLWWYKRNGSCSVIFPLVSLHGLYLLFPCSQHIHPCFFNLLHIHISFFFFSSFLTSYVPIFFLLLEKFASAVCCRVGQKKCMK